MKIPTTNVFKIQILNTSNDPSEKWTETTQTAHYMFIFVFPVFSYVFHTFFLIALCLLLFLVVIISFIIFPVALCTAAVGHLTVLLLLAVTIKSVLILKET